MGYISKKVAAYGQFVLVFLKVYGNFLPFHTNWISDNKISGC